MRRLPWLAMAMALMLLSACDRYHNLPRCAEIVRGTDAAVGWRFDERGLGQFSGSPVQWYRCNAGERFVDGACVGTALRLTRAEAVAWVEDFSKASSQHWRLPTLSEMRSLRQSRCVNPAIDPRVFPSALVDHYWAFDRSEESRGLACSFYTFNGHGFCRDRPDAEHPFWLVRVR